MRLFIGGFSQGKLSYVLQKCEKPFVVIDGDETESLHAMEIQENSLVWNHFHLFVRSKLYQHEDWESEDIIREANGVCESYLQCSIICDEVGNGIVPIDAFERKYREMVGRVCCILAQQAESVERIHCGLGIKLK